MMLLGIMYSCVEVGIITVAGNRQAVDKKTSVILGAVAFLLR